MSMGVGAPVASNAYKRTFFSVEFASSVMCICPFQLAVCCYNVTFAHLFMVDCICVMFVTSA